MVACTFSDSFSHCDNRFASDIIVARKALSKLRSSAYYIIQVFLSACENWSQLRGWKRWIVWCRAILALVIAEMVKVVAISLLYKKNTTVVELSGIVGLLRRGSSRGKDTIFLLLRARLIFLLSFRSFASACAARKLFQHRHQSLPKRRDILPPSWLVRYGSLYIHPQVCHLLAALISS